MASAPYRVICPNCGTRYGASDPSASGKQYRCKKCGEAFIAAVVPAGIGTLHTGQTSTVLPSYSSQAESTAQPPPPPPPPTPSHAIAPDPFLEPSFNDYSAGLNILEGEKTLIFVKLIDHSVAKKGAAAVASFVTYGMSYRVTENFLFLTDRRAGTLAVKKSVGVWAKKPEEKTCAAFTRDQIDVIEVHEDSDQLRVEIAVRETTGPKLIECPVPKACLSHLHRVVAYVQTLKGGWNTPGGVVTTSQKAQEVARRRAEREEFLSTLPPNQRALYEQMEQANPATPPQERLVIARRIDEWENNRQALLPQLPQKIQRGEPVTIGVLLPAVEKLIEANIDPGDRLLLVMAGHSLIPTLCMTNMKVMLIVARKDLEASNSGAGGAAVGGMAGERVGAGIGVALGAEGGLAGMIAGGLIGSALGMLAGGAAGQAMTSKEVVDIVPIAFLYASIANISSGYKTIRTVRGDESLPMISFVSTMYPIPLEFVYLQRDVDYGNYLVRLIKAVTAQQAREHVAAQVATRAPVAPSGPAPAAGGREEILASIKQLSDLKTVGAITEEEFQAKKKDLLGRL